MCGKIRVQDGDRQAAVGVKQGVDFRDEVRQVLNVTRKKAESKS